VPEQTLGQATINSLTAMIQQESAKPPSLEPRGRRPEEREARAPVQRAEPAEPAQNVAEAVPLSLSMPRWARHVPFHALRRLFETVIMSPLVRTFARLEIEGLDHVRRLEPPFLLLANHRSNLDTVLLKVAVPQPSGDRIAPAMTTRLHRTFFEGEHGSLYRRAREWIEVRLAQLLFNAWPISETGNVLSSLSYAANWRTQDSDH
jgi:hypothetical protein